MARIIICNLCHLHVEEDKLLVHLVTKHNWALVRDRADYAATRSVTSAKPVANSTPASSMKAAEPPTPRLGPQGRAMVAARSKPTPCRYCHKLFPADSLLAHTINCTRRKMSGENSSVTSSGASAGIVTCPHCGIQVKRLAKHIKKMHPAVVGQSVTNEQPVASINTKKISAAKSTLTCPFCKTEINAKNYEKHIKDRCPKRLVSLVQQSASPTRLPVTCHDPAIAAYLARNPAPETIGPQGTPQAKFRQGTYGLAGMEYDSWGRGK